MRVLGIDPGLERTGWGIIDHQGSRLTFIAAGVIKSKSTETMAVRLCRIDAELTKVIEAYKPDTAAIEETFVNTNSASSLKLGQARGVAILSPARFGLEVAEYAANTVKKSVVGAGHAAKDQVGMMIKVLLPTSGELEADAADALAVAICHAHHYKPHKI
ncbi:MAG: crossover junction endodeoxyribonuclease RuvC [Alphaproteobacteria bacterium RIFCSPHIGHO2_12_FULL_45_9]|nr:MAG: crossover junction endodeoxyribonuclease RuvC [Alphaproteobacteria bacterium RIFCSPHIGHO2_02_FULL_46_13]OFW98359.1 MAG: crossover junction endodeoxyribonuclease RuvC [Alphaproteobacteria bacterium RIFCSPHIGHO2_12_FULL_45_9]